MLSRRLFEGPNIQKLLARVQSELGPNAQIVSAEKVRRGGVGGFFARETYQVIVDAPDEPAARPSLWPSRRRTSRTTPGMAGEQDGMRRGRKVAVPSTEGAPFAEVLRRLTENAEPVPPRASAPAVAPASVTPALAASAPAELPAAPASIDETADEDLLALLRRMPGKAEPAADGQLETASVTAGPAVALAAEMPAGDIEVDIEVDEMQAGDMQAGEMQAGDMQAGEIEAVESAESWLDAAPGTTGTSGEADEDMAGAEEAAPAGAMRNLPVGQLQAVPLPSADRKAGLTGVTPARARPALKKLGVPTSLLPADGRLGLVPALYRSLSRMPAAPAVCLQPGEVMAVVGAADRALLLASRLALSIGLDPGEVVIASPTGDAEEMGERVLISSGEAAESYAQLWADRPAPTVVSIAAAPGSGRDAWAANVIGALQPAAVWGVVDATRKPEDVSSWSRAVGQVDALALEDLDATTSPAAVLGTGIPVALLDGQLASPEAWTALLAGRLRAAA